VQRPVVYVLMLVAAVGSWLFLDDLRPPNPTQSPLPGSNSPYPAGPSDLRVRSDVIRIASFNIQTFGQSKIRQDSVMRLIAEIIGRFDIVAIQEIRSKQQNVMPRLLEYLNQGAERYDFVIGLRKGRSANYQEQFAFVYDQTRVEVDRYQLYSIEDPRDDLHREPYVAWFRAKSADPNEAFTFTLVNVHIDPDEQEYENTLIDEIFRAVRNDGRGEDDVIMLGDFNASVGRLQELVQMPELNWVLDEQQKTNVAGTHQYDNICFSPMYTDEYTGRGGVSDFVREYNLLVKDGLKISDHLPVWAEFSIYEGGSHGRTARISGPSQPDR